MQARDRHQGPAYTADCPDHICRPLANHEPGEQRSSYEAEQIGGELDRSARFHCVSVNLCPAQAQRLPGAET